MIDELPRRATDAAVRAEATGLSGFAAALRQIADSEIPLTPTANLIVNAKGR